MITLCNGAQCAQSLCLNHELWLQELEIGTLQTALHALSSSCNDPQQPATCSHAAAAPQPDTGVFGRQPPATAASIPLSANTSTHASLRNVTPIQQTHQNMAPPAPLARHRHAGRFQYPEDTPSPAEQAKGQRQKQHIPPSTCSQHAHHSSASGRGHASQPAAYTVEEPDSPAQPTGSAAQPGAQQVPCRATGTGARDPPAGCLYEDTTIRRVITPLKNGRPLGAWAHHEEITVRQVRQINQSEARLHHLPPPHQPHILQGKGLILGCLDCRRRHSCVSRKQHDHFARVATPYLSKSMTAYPMTG